MGCAPAKQSNTSRQWADHPDNETELCMSGVSVSIALSCKVHVFYKEGPVKQSKELSSHVHRRLWLEPTHLFHVGLLL